MRQIHPKCGTSVTEQHHEKSCNVNNILAKYQKTGLIDHINRHEGHYGSVSGTDYKEALDLIKAEESRFMDLPAAVRAKFDNNPANYLDLVTTEEGIETLQNMFTPEEKPEKTDPGKPDSPGTENKETEGKPEDPAVT